MRRSLLIGALCLVGSPAFGAPLLTGFGGPLDLGEPLADSPSPPIDLTALAPGGLQLYEGGPWPELFMNWSGSLSVGRGFCCFNTQWELPSGPTGAGLMPPRLVALQARPSSVFPAEPPGPFMFLALDPIEDGRERIVATWFMVPDRPPDLEPALYNSWQALITPVGDAGDFDVEFRYERCHWTRAPHRNDVPHSVMGFDAGQGEDGPGWMWPGSLTDDMRLLCDLSNVREPGVYRYAFRGGQPTGCGYDLDPPPGPDRCADGNHLPGDGCSPACYIEPDIDGDGRFEPPYPDAPDPRGVYDDCTDLADPLCDNDPDGDGVPDVSDNCPTVANPDQHNYNQDAIGDACDGDSDNDGLFWPHDPAEHPDSNPDDCPFLYNAGVRVIDPAVFRAFQTSDPDGDGLGDQCDPDDDGDGIDDCGTDGVCSETDNGADDDRDGRIDEDGECQPGSDRFDQCDRGDRDLQDNDADGWTDESTERALPRIFWPGPDPDGSEDNCRKVPNPQQEDLDGDGIGDACDPDIDGDGVDNCLGGLCGPAFDGRDNDRDGQRDEEGECALGCDPAADLADQDGDGYVDEAFETLAAGDFPPQLDNCPLLANPDQADRNRDGKGDACADDDGDGLPGHRDNCIDVANRDQLDTDRDGEGDACDEDDDDDGVPDVADVCPLLRDDQTDTDGDGRGDACDEDDDDDGVNDAFDRCPTDFDPDQADLDGDGIGDACDDDDDGDGTPDTDDRCPRLADDQTDTDGDGEGDACDPDDDGDGVPDPMDGCPLIADADAPDLDGDGISDACDPSDDRPFDLRSPAEQCAILIADRASTADRLAHCPPPSADGCAALPGSRDPRPTGWLLGLALLGLALRRLALRRRRSAPAT